MRTLLLLIGFAFALCHAVVSPRPACEAEKHYGKLSLYETVTAGGALRQTYSSHIDHSAAGDAFTWTTSVDETSGAIFYFLGCQGGDEFRLYCTNCSGNNRDIVATESTAVDGNGEPDMWLLYNAGNSGPDRREDMVARQVEHSKVFFKWYPNGFVGPVTHNNDNSIQPPSYYAVWNSKQDFVFTASATSYNQYFAFGWEETQAPANA